MLQRPCVHARLEAATSPHPYISATSRLPHRLLIVNCEAALVHLVYAMDTGVGDLVWQANDYPS